MVPKKRRNLHSMSRLRLDASRLGRALFCFGSFSAFGLESAGAQSLPLGVGDSYQYRFGSSVLDETLLLPTMDIKGGVTGSVSTNLSYNSNLFLAENETSDLLLTVAPSLFFRSNREPGALFTLEAGYTPSMISYEKNSDLNSFNQAGSLRFGFDGSKTTIKARASYAEVSDTDRYTRGILQGDRMDLSLDTTYQIAPRTKISMGVDAYKSRYSSGALGQDTYSAHVSGSWDFSERLSFGPRLGYSSEQSKAVGTRETYRGLAQVRYNSGNKLNLSLSGGMEMTESKLGKGGMDSGFTGDLNLSYRISDRWLVSGGIRYTALPPPSLTEDLQSDLSLSTSLVRSLDNGSIALGVDWSQSSFNNSQQRAGRGDGDETFTSLGLTYQRGLWQDRASLTTSARYSFNEGRRSYSQLMLSLGLNFSF